MTPDERLLVDFVIWRCRSGSLPPDVFAAADRLAPTTSRPANARRATLSYGRYRLSAFDRSGGQPVDSQPLEPGEAVERALDEEPLYVLLSDVGEAIAQGWEAPLGGVKDLGRGERSSEKVVATLGPGNDHDVQLVARKEK